MAKIVELITTQDRRGTGKENDPIRLVEQLWTKSGRLIAENDPCGKNWFNQLNDLYDLQTKESIKAGETN